MNAQPLAIGGTGHAKLGKVLGADETRVAVVLPLSFTVIGVASSKVDELSGFIAGVLLPRANVGVAVQRPPRVVRSYERLREELVLIYKASLES